MGHGPPLQADAHQAVAFAAEGRRGTFQVDGEGIAVRGGCVTLVEVVDELFRPHRGRVGKVAVLNEPAGHRVGSSVHVNGKGGPVVVLGVYEGVDAVVLEEGQVVGGFVDRGRASDAVEAFGLVPDARALKRDGLGRRAGHTRGSGRTRRTDRTPGIRATGRGRGRVRRTVLVVFRITVRRPPTSCRGAALLSFQSFRPEPHPVRSS